MNTEVFDKSRRFYSYVLGAGMDAGEISFGPYDNCPLNQILFLQWNSAMDGM